MSDSEARQRGIRSYVLRQGRATESQKRAFDLYWPLYGLDYAGTRRDFSEHFAAGRERIVEIGFGNGEQLLFAAGNEPHRDFIGIEVHSPGVGRALNGIAENGYTNVRVYRHDAVEVLQNEIDDASLQEIRIYFPDPWHKKRHHKRRLVQPALVNLLARKLRPGGLLHLATDWREYVEHMWDVCDNEPMLVATEGPGHAVPRPAWRMQTHFEKRGLNLGHGVWDLLYTRRLE